MFVKQPEIKLIHLQSNTIIDLPSKFYSLKIGKLTDDTPVDIDVSGFSGADIVSRTHLEIRQINGNYYVEDVGSSNGTYLNDQKLDSHKPYKIKFNDKISLGKGDKFTLLFVDINSSNYSDWIKTQLAGAQQTINQNISKQVSNAKELIENQVSNAKESLETQVSQAKQKVETQPSQTTNSLKESIFVWFWNIHRKISNFFNSLGRLLRNIFIFLIVVLFIAITIKVAQPTVTAMVLCRDVPSGGEPCRLRIPFTNENRPSGQRSCDCPYDRAINYSVCGGRSAYAIPGGQEPICYMGEKYSREKWYYSSETSYIDRERAGR